MEGPAEDGSEKTLMRPPSTWGPEWGKDFADNQARFAYFCKAALKAIQDTREMVKLILWSCWWSGSVERSETNGIFQSYEDTEWNNPWLQTIEREPLGKHRGQRRILNWLINIRECIWLYIITTLC